MQAGAQRSGVEHVAIGAFFSLVQQLLEQSEFFRHFDAHTAPVGLSAGLMQVSPLQQVPAEQSLPAAMQTEGVTPPSVVPSPPVPVAPPAPLPPVPAPRTHKLERQLSPGSQVPLL